jgi:hypothetical protein
LKSDIPERLQAIYGANQPNFTDEEISREAKWIYLRRLKSNPMLEAVKDVLEKVEYVLKQIKVKFFEVSA